MNGLVNNRFYLRYAARISSSIVISPVRSEQLQSNGFAWLVVRWGRENTTGGGGGVSYLKNYGRI